MESSSLQELEQIPGVGKTIVYYASNTEHDPELLKWENWKDKE
jgi:hypothetical protein